VRVVTDDRGRAFALPETAQRIVSLIPSITETLFALDRGARLVGITRYCVEPVGRVERIERVGGTKNPDIRRICELAPDLILVNPEENRHADFTALEDAQLPVFVSFPRRVRDTLRLMQQLGALTGAEGAAEQMMQRLTVALAECATMATAPRRRVFCPIWKNPWMSFNGDTYADDMLWLAGGANVCRPQAQRYCTIDLDDVARLQPDVVLLPDEPYVFSQRDVASLAPLAATPALRTGDVQLIDGKALSWYGPRTAEGLRTLRQALHC
jgi:ABC-type Fe3+-hydroxamate transport system substrate-binding protein